MARPCTPRPETTRSKPRCSRPHRIWNTRFRPANSGARNGAKANCNLAPFPAGGPMLRPVAGLERQEPASALRFFGRDFRRGSLEHARLAQARLQKLRGQPTAFLAPLVQLVAMDHP